MVGARLQSMPAEHAARHGCENRQAGSQEWHEWLMGACLQKMLQDISVRL